MGENRRQLEAALPEAEIILGGGEAGGRRWWWRIRGTRSNDGASIALVTIL